MLASIMFYLLSLKEMNQLVKVLYKAGDNMSKSEVAAIKSKVIEEYEVLRSIHWFNWFVVLIIHIYYGIADKKNA